MAGWSEVENNVEQCKPRALRNLVLSIIDVLYAAPNGDLNGDKAWAPETIEHVATAIHSAKLLPADWGTDR